VGKARKERKKKGERASRSIKRLSAGRGENSPACDPKTWDLRGRGRGEVVENFRGVCAGEEREFEKWLKAEMIESNLKVDRGRE